MTTTVLAPVSAGVENQADLNRLDELLKGAKADHDAFEALKRKGAAVVFRCGSKLIEAREIAKRHKLGWYSKLDEYGIAEGVWSRVVFGDFSGGGLLPDPVLEDGPFDDFHQQRRTVQRSPTF